MLFGEFDFFWGNELSFLSEKLGNCSDWLKAGERDCRWEQMSFLGDTGLLSPSAECSGFLGEEKL